MPQILNQYIRMKNTVVKTEDALTSKPMKKRSNRYNTPIEGKIGAMCAKGKCAVCYVLGCSHDCHKGTSK